MYKFNEFQTPLTEELLKSLPDEVREKLLEYIETVPYIKNLVSEDRPRAKDLPRTSKGKIIIDLANPHIIEDMDYFRGSALHFQQHGCYTFLRPNANPSSEFGKWLNREVNRLWHGMVRPSDGEWIPGYMYYYLNYHPIVQTIVVEGTMQGDRITDLPEVWEGIYWTFHYIDQARFGGIYNDFKGGQHCVEIAKRGASKSYILSALLARNFIVGISKKFSKKIKGTITAYERETIEVTSDGTLNKFYDSINFNAEYTEFPRNRLKDAPNDLNWIMGYTNPETNLPKGSLNSVKGLTSKDNPDKGRGKRQNLFLYEEFGKFKKFLDTYQVNKSSVQEGDFAFGQAFAVGTGGTEGSDFSGALEMIYNPVGYNVYALPNVFDKGIVGDKKTVFFFGAPVNRKGFYNKDGVSDIIGALISILKDRYLLKYNSTDPNMLTRAVAENPVTIQEAIMKRDSTIYPVADLTDTLNDLEFNPRLLDSIECVRLEINGAKISAVPDPDLVPARNFPHKDNKVLGCVEIHKRPVYDSSGNIPWGRYIAGMDPYDDDASQTLSLGSVYVLDLWTDEIVAEYTGRPYYAEEFYETSRRLLLFYNAECNYENNKKGVYKHFSQFNSTYLLAEILEFLKERDPNLRNSYGNKAHGTQSTGGFILKYGRSCLRNWLIKPKEIETISNDQVVIVKVPALKSLKTKALIKELTLFNLEGNFDRHDAMVMLMLLREDKLRLLGEGGVEGAQKNRNNQDDLSTDDFFKKNYEQKLQRIR